MSKQRSAEVEQLILELSEGSDSLQPFEMPFTWKGAKYTFREASEGAALDYRQKYARAMKTNKDGEVISADLGMIAETEAFLVSRCLFKLAADGKSEVNPQVKEIHDWPRKVVKRLYKLAMEVSEIRVDDDDNVEAIDKQIEELQKRKEQLLNGEVKTTEEKVKNE